MLTGTELAQAIARMQEDLEKLQIPEQVFMNATKYVINHLTKPMFLEEDPEKVCKKFLKELRKQPLVKRKAILLACVVFAQAAAKRLYMLFYKLGEEFDDITDNARRTPFPDNREMPFLIGFVIGITSGNIVSLIDELLKVVDKEEEKSEKTDFLDLDFDFEDPGFKFEIICYMASGGPSLAAEFARKLKPLTNQ